MKDNTIHHIYRLLPSKPPGQVQDLYLRLQPSNPTAARSKEVIWELKNVRVDKRLSRVREALINSNWSTTHRGPFRFLFGKKAVTTLIQEYKMDTSEFVQDGQYLDIIMGTGD